MSRRASSAVVSLLTAVALALGLPVAAGAAPSPVSTPALVASPASVTFGPTQVGSSATVPVVVTNTGTSATAKLTWSLTGPDAAQFRYAVSGCPASLPGGQSCRVDVTFTPAAPESGTRTAVLTATGQKGGSVSVPLAGRVSTPASLSVSPGSADLGQAVIGTTSPTQSFTVTNTGDRASGPVTAAATGDFAVTGGTCTGPLAGGATCRLDVVLTPTERGERSGAVTASATPGGTASASLAGRGLRDAVLALTTDGPAHPATLVGASATRTFTLANQGDVATGALDVAVPGAEFAPGGSTCPPSLAAGASCSIEVVFTPSERGERLGSLAVTSAPGGSVSQPLTATGLAPARLVADVAGLDFPATLDGGTSAARTLTVTNTGDVASGAPVVIVSGDFRVDDSTCTAPLAAGGTCAVDVVFAPDDRGARSGAVTVVADPGGSAGAALTGTGLKPATLEVAGPEGFPATVGGETSSRTWTLTNSGDVPTGALDLALDGDAGFSLGDTTCDGPLAAGASCEVEVTFAPGTKGGYVTTLLASASPGGSVGTPITATGLRQATLELGAVPPIPDTLLGEATLVEVPLTNTGDVPTGLVGVSADGAFDAVRGTCEVLAAGETCTLEVVFRPTDRGAATGTLTASATPGGSDTAALAATGLRQATLDLDPSSYTFPATGADRTSAAQEFTVTNTGDVPSGDLSSVLGAGFDVTGGTCASPLAAGASCTVEVVFAPTDPGPWAASLEVSAHPGGTASAALDGLASERPFVLEVTRADGSETSTRTRFDRPVGLDGDGDGVNDLTAALSYDGSEVTVSVTRIDGTDAPAARVLARFVSADDLVLPDGLVLGYDARDGVAPDSFALSAVAGAEDPDLDLDTSGAVTAVADGVRAAVPTDVADGLVVTAIRATDLALDVAQAGDVPAVAGSGTRIVLADGGAAVRASGLTRLDVDVPRAAFDVAASGGLPFTAQAPGLALVVDGAPASFEADLDALGVTWTGSAPTSLVRFDRGADGVAMNDVPQQATLAVDDDHAGFTFDARNAADILTPTGHLRAWFGGADEPAYTGIVGDSLVTATEDTFALRLHGPKKADLDLSEGAAALAIDMVGGRRLFVDVSGDRGDLNAVVDAAPSSFTLSLARAATGSGAGPRVQWSATQPINRLSVARNDGTTLPFQADLRGVPAVFDLRLDDDSSDGGSPLVLAVAGASLSGSGGPRIDEVRTALGVGSLPAQGGNDKLTYLDDGATLNLGVKLSNVKAVNLEGPLGLTLDQEDALNGGTKPVDLNLSLPNASGPPTTATGQLNKPSFHTEVDFVLPSAGTGQPNRFTLVNGTAAAPRSMGALSWNTQNAGGAASASFAFANVSRIVTGCIADDGACRPADRLPSALSNYGGFSGSPAQSATAAGMNRPYPASMSLDLNDFGTSGTSSAAGSMITMNATINDGTGSPVSISNLRFHRLAVDLGEHPTNKTFGAFTTQIPRIYMFVDSNNLPYVANSLKVPPALAELRLGTDGSPATANRRLTWLPGGKCGGATVFGACVGVTVLDNRASGSHNCGGQRSATIGAGFLGNVNIFDFPLVGQLLPLCS